MPSPEFFQVAPVATALERLASHWQPSAPVETIAVSAALQRMSAAAQHSPEPIPAFHKSAVDGYALRASDSFGASASLPALLEVRGELRMGEEPQQAVQPGQALQIHTGGMLPAGADAVVMLEYTQVARADEIEVLRAVAPGEHVIHAGEDMQAGGQIIPPGRRLRPQDIGGLLAAGIREVSVLRAPRVAILSCGDELRPPSAELRPGQVRDINAYTLSALAQALGAQPLRHGIVADDFAAYQQRAGVAFDSCDILLLSAGSSVSARDYTRDVIQGLGAPGVLQHGLAIKPGKPTVLAVCANKPVIGLPGNPVSAFIVARQVLPPLLARYGLHTAPRTRLGARLMQRVASQTGREDWLPVRLETDRDGQRQALPIRGKSNLIFTLIEADGLLHIPLNSGGYDMHSAVEVELF